MRRHLRILDFAISGLLRARARSLVVIAVYSVLVCLFASLLLFVNALQRETHRLLDAAADLIVQRIRGGRHELMPVDRAGPIREIRGVVEVTPRVWGYAFDPPTGATLTLWGADSVPAGALEFREGELPGEGDPQVCVVGSGVAEERFMGPGDRLPLKTADGELVAPRVTGIFTARSALLTNDLVVLPGVTARQVLGMTAAQCTDLAVSVRNPLEVDTVARKITQFWPDARAVSRAQILRTYDAVFDWRGGLWAAFLISLVASFAVLVWDKASGLSAEQYREIGILRAVGWRSRDVLELRLWEGVIISSVSVMTGLLAAQVHLILFDGALFTRILKGWSVLFPSFEFQPALDAYTGLLCLLLAVVPYVAANLVPSWRSSVIDPDSVIRG